MDFATYPAYRLSTRMYGMPNATKSMRLRWCDRFVEITKSMSHCRNPKIYNTPSIIGSRCSRESIFQFWALYIDFQVAKIADIDIRNLQNRLISLAIKIELLKLMLRKRVLRCLGRNRANYGVKLLLYSQSSRHAPIMRMRTDETSHVATD